MQCTNCGGDTKNPKFCSSSCAAKYNNTIGIVPKRKPEGKCRDCLKPITTRKTWCSDCKSRHERLQANMTISQIQNKRKYQISSQIREMARLKYRKLRPNDTACHRCAYDKHVHVCHIRGIADFPETALINEINDMSNLTILCPNCHWELDNGYLKVTGEGIEPIDFLPTV